MMRLWKGLGAVLGLIPEDPKGSRMVQRLWFFFAPAGLCFLVLEGSPLGLWFSRLLLVILAVIFFWDGRWDLPWARKWLTLLGGGYLLSFPLGWVSERIEFPGLLLLLVLLLALYLFVWPLCVTGQIIGFPYNDPPFAPACLLVWGCLCLAWLLGHWVRRLRSR